MVRPLTEPGSTRPAAPSMFMMMMMMRMMMMMMMMMVIMLMVMMVMIKCKTNLPPDVPTWVVFKQSLGWTFPICTGDCSLKNTFTILKTQTFILESAQIFPRFSFHILHIFVPQ